MNNKHVTRRAFLKGAATAAAVAAIGPTIIPATALGAEGVPAPSNRLTMGFIGIGNQGSGHYGSLLGNRDVQMLAISDVRRSVRDRCKKQCEEAYSRRGGDYKGCDAYNDFRELVERKDIDAVFIAVPEHWHAIIVVEAAKAGKDIYCEKPLSHTINEAKQMVAAVRKYGRVFQTGSQQRSDREFRVACEIVRSGRIGPVQTVHVNVGGPSSDAYLPAEPVEEGLDWDRWLGPAPWSAYNHTRASGDFGGGWRMIRDYSGGMMCDWGAHHFDIAQWGLGMDGSGPVEIHPPDGKEYQKLTYIYANGVKVIHDNGGQTNGVLFTGPQGKVEVNRGYLKTWPESLAREPMGSNDVHLYQNRGHVADWLDCIKTRRRPICDVEIGASTIMVCHLGNLAYWLNRPLKWDPVKQEIVGDAEASRMMDLPKRAPWTL